MWARIFPPIQDALPFLRPILRGKSDSPDILRFQEFDTNFEGVFCKTLFTDSIDPASGGSCEQWILDQDLIVNRQAVKRGDSAAMLVNTDRPGVFLEGLPRRVGAVYGYRNDDRKASAPAAHHTGNFGFIRCRQHIKVRKS